MATLSIPRGAQGASAALAALLVAGLSADAAAQQTLRVPQDHATIQAAVEAAQSGDTVLVSKGTYAEHVELLNVNGITLRGKGNPVVLGNPDGGVDDDEGELVAGGIAVSSCNDIEVRGFIVRQTDDAPGIAVSSSNSVTILSCRVEDTWDRDGISISSSNDVVIERCRIEGGGGDGIQLSSSSGVDILKTRVQDAGNDGIHVASSGDIVIERTRIESPDNDGLHCSSAGGSNAILFDRGRIRDTGNDGIHVSGQGNDLTVLKSRIQGTDNDGIHAGSRAVTLEKVAVSDTGNNAFWIKPIAGPDPVAEGEPIDGPVSMIGCRAKGAEDDGLDLDADGAVVSDLRITDCLDSGVRVAGCQGVSLTGVRISKVDDGVLLFGVSGSTFEDFRMSKLGDGLYTAFDTASNTFENIRMQAPAGDGFDLDGPDNSFIGNVVSKAGDHGFSVIVGGNSFIGNKATGSGILDLEDTTGGANTYEDNVFGTTSSF